METWKPLRNFPSYDGSTDGRIMNIKTQRVLKTFTNEYGYKLVCLRKNGKQYTVKVAKVIAETFQGRPTCLHRVESNLENLEYMSYHSSKQCTQDIVLLLHQ